MYFCEYTFRDQNGFRHQMELMLAAGNGGALGITSLKEISIEYAERSVSKNGSRYCQKLQEEEPDS